MQAPMMNDERMYQEQGYQQQAPKDDVQMAKEALGLDAYEQQLQAMQAQLAESNQKAMFNELSSQYKNVPIEEVNKALAELEQTNPQMAQMMKSDKSGLDLMFKKVQAEMKPTETPDEITDSGDAGGEMSDFNKKLKDGTASEVELGEFILGAK